MTPLSTLLKPLATAAALCGLATVASAQVLPWNQLSPTTSPSNRERVGSATDGSVMYFYGGQVSTTTNGYDELWSFDGTNHTLLTASGASAGPRTSPGVAWDASRNTLVVFGGKGAAGVWADYETTTWEWTPTGGWTDVTPVSSPDPRWLYNMEYVPGLGAVLHGGVAQSAPGASAYRSNETWAWNGLGWTLLSNAGPARGNGTLVYRPTTNDMVYFGGVDVNNVKTSDTFIYDIATNVWTQVNTPTVPYSSATPGAAGMVGMGGYWDPVVGKVIIHGGQSSGASSLTWEFDGLDWTDVTSASSFTRRNFDIAWVAGSSRAFTAFGNNGSAATNQTWERGVTAIGTFTVKGTDCPTSAGLTATLSSSAMPAINANLVVDFANLTVGTLPLALVGVSDSTGFGVPLPLPLAVVFPGSGAGCNLQVSDEVGLYTLVPDVTGTGATLTLPIPNDLAFVGLTGYVQGIQIELGASLTAANTAYAEVMIGQL